MKADEIIIEQHEHFVKQTYRNRCRIYGPNGLQTLSIPIVHKNISHTPVKDIKISYDAPWNKIHWKAICSSYRNSPFLEFYEDEFQNVYEKKTEFLFDLNMAFTKIVFDIFKIKKTISLTENFEDKYSSGLDYRNIIHPKKEIINLKPYHQVFSDRHGFINDLSCIDFLFNIGNKEIPEIRK